MNKIIKIIIGLTLMIVQIGCYPRLSGNTSNDEGDEIDNGVQDFVESDEESNNEESISNETYIDDYTREAIVSWEDVTVNDVSLKVEISESADSNEDGDLIISVDDYNIVCDDIIENLILDNDNLHYGYEVFDADGDGKGEFILLVRNKAESIEYVSVFIILKEIDDRWCISEFPYLYFDSDSDYAMELLKQNFASSCEIKYVVANAISDNLGITYYVYSDEDEKIVGNINLPVSYDKDKKCFYADEPECEFYNGQTKLDHAYEVYYNGELELSGSVISLRIYCKDRFNVVFKVGDEYVRIDPEIASVFSDIGYAHPEFILFDVTGDGEDEIIVVLHGGASGARCAMHIFTNSNDFFSEIKIPYECFVSSSDFWNMIAGMYSDEKYRLAYNPVCVDEAGLYISYVIFEEDAEDISQRIVNAFLKYDETVEEMIVSDIVEADD